MKTHHWKFKKKNKRTTEYGDVNAHDVDEWLIAGDPENLIWMTTKLFNLCFLTSTIDNLKKKKSLSLLLIRHYKQV